MQWNAHLQLSLIKVVRLHQPVTGDIALRVSTQPPSSLCGVRSRGVNPQSAAPTFQEQIRLLFAIMTAWLKAGAPSLSPISKDDPPTLSVPVSSGTRSLTVPAAGNMSVTTPIKQSRPARESRRTSKLWMQTCQSFKTRTTPVGRKSLTLSISGSPSFSFFRGKTNKARHKLTCAGGSPTTRRYCGLR
jgi:hypothetical protein